MRFGIIAALVLLHAPPAGAVDLHQFWDSRCHDCHGHAGDFARKSLSVKDGVLVGRRNADLKRFLALHEAGAEQAGPLYAMLLAQAQTKPVYQQKCAGCHGTAADLARASLVSRDGVVSGRDNGQPIAEFLKRHGKLTPEEVPVVVDSLARVLGETGGKK